MVSEKFSPGTLLDDLSDDTLQPHPMEWLPLFAPKNVSEVGAGHAARQAGFLGIGALEAVVAGVDAPWVGRKTRERKESSVENGVTQIVEIWKRQDTSTEPENRQPKGSDASTPDMPPPLSSETDNHAPMPAVAAFEHASVSQHGEREQKAVPRAAKSAAARAVERTMSTTDQKAGHSEQLGKRDLMRLAKSIKIDGVRLKDIYAAQRIDEVGLRAIIDCYLRGGDIKQQLTEELLAKEQTYERDPFLRHDKLTPEQHYIRGGTIDQESPNGAGTEFERFKQLTPQAHRTTTKPTKKSARSIGRIVSHNAKLVRQDLVDHSNITDWISIAAVVVLYAIILILLLG